MSQCPDLHVVDLPHAVGNLLPEEGELIQIEVYCFFGPVFEGEDQKDHWFHHVFLGDVGNGELYSILHVEDQVRVGDGILLAKRGRRDECGLLVLGHQDVVVDLFVEIYVGEGLLVFRFLFYQLFHLFYVEFADGVEVGHNFGH